MEMTFIPKCAGGCSIIRTNDGMAIQQNDRIHTLNMTAGEIVDLCDGSRSIHEIIHEVQERYGKEDITEIVVAFLNQLHQNGIIEVSA